MQAALAQGIPGALDTTFQPDSAAVGLNILRSLPDGSVLAAGNSSKIVRLRPDGSIDSSFHAELAADFQLWEVMPQPNGQLLVAGSSVAENLIRLNADGTRDTNFPAVVAPGVQSLGLQGENVLLSGTLSSVQGVQQDRLARITKEGVIDSSFMPQFASQTNPPTALEIMDDGRVVLAFSPFQETLPAARVIRLNPNGEIDPTFTPFLPTPARPRLTEDFLGGLRIDKSGGILVFGSLNVGANTGIFRLNSDGSFDSGFRASVAPETALVRQARVQSDGKIVIAGTFQSVNGESRAGLARLFPNGEVDETFVPGFAPNNQLTDLAIQPSGHVVVAGYLEAGNSYLLRLFGGDPAPALPEILLAPEALALNVGQTGTLSVQVRSATLPTYQWQKAGEDLAGATNNTLSFRSVTSDDAGEYQVIVRNQVGAVTSPTVTITVHPAATTPGMLDLSFDPGLGADGEVTAMAVQSDGRILIAGGFQHVQGVARRGIARLRADGQLDFTFDPGTGFEFVSHLRPPSLVTEPFALFTLLAEQLDGHIMAAGYFTNYNGVARPGLVRMESDGRIDANYVPPADVEGAVLLLGDGRVLTRRPGVLLNADGTRDSSFKPPLELQGVPGPLLDLTAGSVTANGDWLISGLTTINVGGFNSPFNFLLRLRPDGSKARGFLAEEAFQIAFELPDRRIVTGAIQIGPYAHSGGGLALLLPDGAVDTNVVNGRVAANAVETFALQPNGKILVASGSSYDSQGTFHAPSFYRMHPDGRPDSRFATTTPANTIQAIAVQPDGNILVGGTFTNLQGVVRSRIARFIGGEPLAPPDILFPPVGGIAAIGQSIALTVRVAANPAPIYQWLWNGQPLSQATNATLVLPNLTSTNRGDYSVFVSNSFGAVTSSVAVVRVILGTPPKIVSPPQSQSVREGANVVLSVTATNAAPLAYQWQRNGTNLVAATNDVIVLRNVRLAAAGEYRVVVTSEFGTVTSEDAVLTVAPAGIVDPAFDPGDGPEIASSSPPILPPAITSILATAGGKWLVAGDFSSFDGVQRNQIARLLPNGEVDPSFDPGVGVRGGPWVPGPNGRSLTSIKVIVAQPRGKVLIGGAFETVSGIRYPCLARLNQDGSVDTSFKATGVTGGPLNVLIAGDTATVWAIALQADGKILIGGTFNTVNGIHRSHLARLHPDGTLDATFDPGDAIMDSGQPNLDVRVEQIVLPADGYVWARGPLSERVSGSWYRPGVARFKADGTWDHTIPNPSILRDYDREVRALAVASNGKLLAAVTVWLEDAGPHQLVQLNADLTLDPSFSGQLTADAPIDQIVTLPDGALLVAGRFTSVAGIRRIGLARLTAAGVVDPTFDPGSGPDNGVGNSYGIATRGDGEIAISGGFTTFDGAARSRIALLDPDNPSDARLRLEPSAEGKIELSLRTLPGKSYSLETTTSLSGRPWQALSTVLGDGTRQVFVQIRGPTHRFFRVQVSAP